MHETALAKRILEVVLERAGGQRVESVRGVIAEDEALSRDALAFHFRAHARGTLAEQAELALELVHLAALCKGCGQRFLPDHHLHLCPRCGSTDATLDGEPGVRISDITVHEP